MDKQPVTLVLLRKIARELLKDKNIYNYTKSIVKDFLKANENYNKLFSPNNNYTFFIEGVFSPIGIRSYYGGYSISDDVAIKLSRIGFSIFGKNANGECYKHCYKFSESFNNWRFDKYDEFYSLLSDKISRNDYTTCIICFYILIFMISEIVCENTSVDEYYVYSTKIGMPRSFFC